MRTILITHLPHHPAEPGYMAADFGLEDKNDCVIRAFANVGVDTYPNLRDLFFRKGRKQFRGTYVTTTHEVAKMFGATYTAIGATGKKRQRFLQMMQCGADDADSKGCTVANIASRYPTGRHIVSVRGHVFALINGRIIDTFATRPRTRVIGVYSFS